MQATRERSLGLISERDAEIQRLKSELLVEFSSLPATPTLPQHQKNYGRSMSTGSKSSLSEQPIALDSVHDTRDTSETSLGT